MKDLIFVVICCVSLFSSAQEKKKDRYQFAHTYFGLESEVLPQSGSFSVLNNSGTIERKSLPTRADARILIGGTHFWNHADFYVSIPVANFNLLGDSEAYISNGVLTGFRYFPLKIKPNAIRPFAGVGFGGADFRSEGFEGEGPTDNNRQWYFEGGVSYRKGGAHLFDFGVRHFNQKSFQYANSRSSFEKINLNEFNFMVSYKRLFDFTQNYGKESMKKYVKDAYEKFEKEGALSTFSIGLGFSATIPLEKIEYMERIGFLNQQTTKNGNIDVGVGYYFNKWDAATRISYRPLQQRETAYGYTTELKTNALAFEAFKFLGDYHGFVPFAGPYVGLNNYNYSETDHGSTVVDFSENKLAYGITFGWDIRLSDVDFIILRTNLRYTPNLGYKKDQLNYTNRQIEFNFIQLVVYPERWKKSKNL